MVPRATIAVMLLPIYWGCGLQNRVLDTQAQEPAIHPIDMHFPFFRLRRRNALPKTES
jgi:hypothetical protein